MTIINQTTKAPLTTSKGFADVTAKAHAKTSQTTLNTLVENTTNEVVKNTIKLISNLALSSALKVALLVVFYILAVLVTKATLTTALPFLLIFACLTLTIVTLKSLYYSIEHTISNLELFPSNSCKNL